MANETLSSHVVELAAVAIEAAYLASKSRVDLARLLSRKELKKGQNSSRHPISPASTAAELTEGNSATATIYNPTANTLTPGYKAVHREVITDLATFTAAEDAADAGKRGGRAITRKRNQDIFALFAGFSNSVGTTDTDITAALVRQAKKILMQADEDVEDLILCMTPEVFDDLWADMQSTSGSNSLLSDNVRDAIMAGAEDVKILGCQPVIVASGISETGDVTCGLFNRDALGITLVPPDIHTGMQYIAAQIAMDLVFSSWYAVGEKNDAGGVALLVDGADS
jgi:hypothetical protein